MKAHSHLFAYDDFISISCLNVMLYPPRLE